MDDDEVHVSKHVLHPPVRYNCRKIRGLPYGHDSVPDRGNPTQVNSYTNHGCLSSSIEAYLSAYQIRLNFINFQNDCEMPIESVANSCLSNSSKVILNLIRAETIARAKLLQRSIRDGPSS